MTEIKALHMAMVPQGVLFIVDVNATVPNTVFLDPLRIHQLISNGLTNALKVCDPFLILYVSCSRENYSCCQFSSLQHTTSGEITLRVTLCDAPTPWSTWSDEQLQNDHESSPDSGIRFEVIDTGSGLEGVDPTMLFEPFAQGSSAGFHNTSSFL